MDLVSNRRMQAVIKTEMKVEMKVEDAGRSPAELAKSRVGSEGAQDSPNIGLQKKGDEVQSNNGKKRQRTASGEPHKRPCRAGKHIASMDMIQGAQIPPVKPNSPMTLTAFISQAFEVVRQCDTGSKYLWPRVTRDNVSLMLKLAGEQCSVCLEPATPECQPLQPNETERNSEKLLGKENQILDREEDCTSDTTSVYDQDGSEAEYYDDELQDDSNLSETVSQEQTVIATAQGSAVSIADSNTKKACVLSEAAADSQPLQPLAAVCSSPATSSSTQSTNPSSPLDVNTTIPAIRVPSPFADGDEEMAEENTDPYAQDIVNNFLTMERRHLPNQLYMTEVQSDINDKMRAVLVDWMCEVCDQFEFRLETFFLTISMVDRYLGHHAVQRRTLQLVGLTCCFIAAKYEEHTPPGMDEFLYIAANTYDRKEMILMERSILDALAYTCTVPSPLTFLDEWLPGCSSSPAFTSLAHFLAMAASICVSMLAYTPSQIAAACLHIACEVPRQAALARRPRTHYDRRELASCITDLYRCLVKLEQGKASGRLQAIYKRYESEECHRVAPTVSAWLKALPA